MALGHYQSKSKRYTCSDSTFLLPERNLLFRCILRKTERYLHKSVHFSLICNNQEDYKQAKCPQQIFAILWYIYIIVFYAAL